MRLMAAEAFIQCRVSQATKAALRAAAERQQLTGSALLKRMLELTMTVAGAEQNGDVGRDRRPPHASGSITHHSATQQPNDLICDAPGGLAYGFANHEAKALVGRGSGRFIVGWRKAVGFTILECICAIAGLVHGVEEVVDKRQQRGDRRSQQQGPKHPRRSLASSRQAQHQRFVGEDQQ